MFALIRNFTQLRRGDGNRAPKTPWAWENFDDEKKADWCESHPNTNDNMPGYTEHCPVRSS